jgi:hypothetical protein
MPAENIQRLAGGRVGGGEVACLLRLGIHMEPQLVFLPVSKLCPVIVLYQTKAAAYKGGPDLGELVPAAASYLFQTSPELLRLFRKGLPCARERR